MFTAQIGKKIDSAVQQCHVGFFFPSEETVLDLTSLTSLLVLFDSWPDFPPPTKKFLFAICLSEDTDPLELNMICKETLLWNYK